MAGSAFQKRWVLALGLVSALFAAATGIVAVLQVKAMWAIALAITAIVVGSAAGIVDKVAMPHAGDRAQAQQASDQAQAVGLMLIRDGAHVSLIAQNQQRYEVSSVNVDFWSDTAHNGAARALPPFELARSPEISCTPIGGGGLNVSVSTIRPSPNRGSGTGPVLGKWSAPSSPTPVVFEVDWLDQQRMARRLVGRANLTDPMPVTFVDLSPSPPITTPLSWSSRITKRFKPR